MPTRRWGLEKIVNTTTAGTQWMPAVAGLAGGGFVVVWADVSATRGIRAQRFDALGNKAGGEIVIATGEGHSQPAVTGLADGGFYVTWTRQVAVGTNYIEGNVYGADGAFLRYQPVVFAFAADDNPTVAALGNGALVAWRAGGSQAGSDLAFRIFDGAGAGGGIIGSARPGDASPPAVAVAPSQDIFVVAEFIQGSGFGVATYIMSVQGFQIGSQSGFIQATGIGSNARMQVAWLDPSTYAVAYETYYGGARGYEIEMAVYTVTNPPPNPVASPTLLKLPFQVNARSAGNQYGLTMTSLPTGGAVVAWQDGNAPGFSVLLQAFDAGGNRLGAEYRVTNSGEYGVTPAITALADGRVVVTWVGPGDDGSDDIVMQIIDPRDGIVTGGAAADTLHGHDLVNDELSGLGGNDTLYGLGGDDALFGGLGNDVLDGGRGADEMYGGRGDDLFILDNPGDQVFELPGQGSDTVQTSAFSLDLAVYPNVENATLTGALALTARGTSGANTLNGAANSAANVLTGLGGNDLYILGAGDTVVEAPGGGTDTVQSAAVSLNLAGFANVENITLTGTLALSATGDANANVLDGVQNSAANALIGLGGDDTYIVGAGDAVVEAAGGGTDTVESALISLNLASYANVERIRFTGALPLSGIGNAGANYLDGSLNTAANALTGLAGNDIYIVGAGDTVVEQPGGGTDLVWSSLINVNLATYPNVEQVLLAGALPLSATGTAGADVLNGAFNTAANVLTGLGGNDSYFVGTGDIVVEAAGGGTDTVSSSVGYTLGVGSEVEVLRNGAAAGVGLTLAGNALAQTLVGNAGNDTLAGGGGGDILIGNGGLDVLIGATGADMFRFLLPTDSTVGANRDVILAFAPAQGDKIDLSAIDANGALAGDPLFIWRGTAAFTGAAGELRYSVSGPDVVVQGTLAGGAASFEIRVAGIGALAAGDFQL